jgi:hypothetical protein
MNQELESGGFYYDPHHDTNDEKPWSEADIADLRASIEHGSTLEETAAFLCRAGTPFEVARKAKELGLHWQKGGQKRKGRAPSA